MIAKISGTLGSDIRWDTLDNSKMHRTKQKFADIVGLICDTYHIDDMAETVPLHEQPGNCALLI